MGKACWESPESGAKERAVGPHPRRSGHLGLKLLRLDVTRAPVGQGM